MLKNAHRFELIGCKRLYLLEAIKFIIVFVRNFFEFDLKIFLFLLFLILRVIFPTMPFVISALRHVVSKN